MNDLQLLVGLLTERNAIDERIARLIGRPAITGHIGEYIAANILDITLVNSASNRSHDGHFSVGPLAGCTVNIKFYTKQESILDLPKDADLMPESLPDYYLVLTGAKLAAMSSRGTHRPLFIESIFLFDAKKLVHQLKLRANKLGKNVKIGVATSVAKQFWDEAEIYPTQRNNLLVLTNEQKNLLTLFH